MKVWVLLLSFLFLLYIGPNQRAFAINVSAHAALVMDVTTGDIIFSKNAEEPRAPASLTKIITTIVAIEKGDLDKEITVSKKAAFTGGSSLHLQEGDSLPLIDLLYGLMLTSGNDGAVAVAESIGGSVEGFAAMMNEWAQTAGAHDSTFRNPHGLPQGGHLTTAYDLAVLTRRALQNPFFAEIVATKEYDLNAPGLTWKRVVQNHNRLLYSFAGTTGVKTGYTNEAGRCLVASAAKANRQVIVVLLNSPDRWQDAARLLVYSLEDFNYYRVVEKGERVYHTTQKGQKVPIYAGNDLDILVPKKESVVITRKIIVPQNITGPLPKGTTIGRMEVLWHEKYYEVSLVLGEDVPPPTFFDRIRSFFRWFRYARE